MRSEATSCEVAFMGGFNRRSTSNAETSVRNVAAVNSALVSNITNTSLFASCFARRRIDEATTGSSTLPPAVTFTPSGFNVNPTLVPVSLVAGASTSLDVSFTTGNPWPANGKLIFEVPATFVSVLNSAATIAQPSQVDGSFSVAATGTGPWTVTVTRTGDGAEVNANVAVGFRVTNIVNQKFEGPSGEFSLFKTTLNDGTTAIDESSAEGDAIGTKPPGVIFTPSGGRNDRAL